MTTQGLLLVLKYLCLKSGLKIMGKSTLYLITATVKS